MYISLERYLELSGGVKRQAAKQLAMSRPTLDVLLQQGGALVELDKTGKPIAYYPRRAAQ